MDLGCDVGLDGKGSRVAEIQGGLQDPADHALTLSRIGVLDLTFLILRAVLDVDMLDEGKGSLIKIPGFLRAMAFANGITRVKDDLQVGRVHLLQQYLLVFRAHAAPSGAVLVHHHHIAVSGDPGQFLHPANRLAPPLVLKHSVVGIGHDPNEAGAEALHPGNGRFELLHVHLEIGGDRPSPVGDRGSQTDHAHLLLLEGSIHLVEGGLIDVTDVGLADQTQLEGVPPQRLVDSDLLLQLRGAFIRDTCYSHGFFPFIERSIWRSALSAFSYTL